MFCRRSSRIFYSTVMGGRRSNSCRKLKKITAAAIELAAATTATATPDKTETASMSAAAELATAAANPGDITAAADVEIGTKTGVKAVATRGEALRELSKVWAGERRFMSIGEFHLSVLLRNLRGGNPVVQNI